MQTLRVVVLATSCFLARAGWSDDVDYKLDLKELNGAEPNASLELPAIVISDRVWAAPGIEQSTKHLLPPRPFDFAKPYQRIRIKHVPGTTHVSYSVPNIDPGPEWLDDAVWPLTRELYGAGQEDTVFGQLCCQEEFTFGGVTFQ